MKILNQNTEEKIRNSGILLHPTSLASSPGIGTLGQSAYQFIDWLHEAKQSLWQVLPLGPTGYGDSPYASFSTFAGNPLLIDIDTLYKKGYLWDEDMVLPDSIKNQNKAAVDFGALVQWKLPILKRAAKSYLFARVQQYKKQSDNSAKDPYAHTSYIKFVRDNAYWLEDYALFMSIKDFHDKKAIEEGAENTIWFLYWPKDLAQRDEKALANWKKNNKDEIEQYKIIQFFFFVQWKLLKTYANERGIKIIGDIPIFVAPDSSDVWAHKKFFQLDSNAKPKAVAGVPPDYFSKTGQLWGNPLYNWKTLKKDHFRWWVQRIEAMLELVDYVRIDHFRGFEAYWSVAYGEKTAVNGKWIKAPGKELFKTLQRKLGEKGKKLPIIAEDLGVITPEVESLRDSFQFPGMKVLQFAFSLDEKHKGALLNSFLPHMYSSNFVVYTGTHDNDTLCGWFFSLKKEEQDLIMNYLEGVVPTNGNKDYSREQVVSLFLKEAFSSVAKSVVIPFQDLYMLGSEARMNTPSSLGGTNWQWRMSESMIVGKEAEKKAEMLQQLNLLYNRNKL